MKIDWNQTGMPTSFVGQVRKRSTLSEFKSVLRDAQNQVLSSVDTESMAEALVESDGRNYVEMVRDLSRSLANAEKELEASNRRYERLVADLEKRGIRIDENGLSCDESPGPSPVTTANADVVDEWEEWNLKFQSLLG